MGGTHGSIFRIDGGRATPVPAPETAGTVYGIWGASPDDLWAVGGDLETGSGSFVWHLESRSFVNFALPLDPKGVLGLYKVWGSSPSDVWVVGTGGTVLRYDGTAFAQVTTGLEDPLFTVYCAAPDRAAVVGGTDLGVLLETGEDRAMRQAALPQGTHQLFGIYLTDRGGYAVGQDAVVLSRGPTNWVTVETRIESDGVLHSVWVDPTGGVWTVGGNLSNPPLGDGTLVHFGAPDPGSQIVDDGGAITSPSL